LLLSDVSAFSEKPDNNIVRNRSERQNIRPIVPGPPFSKIYPCLSSCHLRHPHTPPHHANIYPTVLYKSSMKLLPWAESSIDPLLVSRALLRTKHTVHRAGRWRCRRSGLGRVGGGTVRSLATPCERPTGLLWITSFRGTAPLSRLDKGAGALKSRDSPSTWCPQNPTVQKEAIRPIESAPTTIPRRPYPNNPIYLAQLVPPDTKGQFSMANPP